MAAKGRGSATPSGPIITDEARREQIHTAFHPPDGRQITESEFVRLCQETPEITRIQLRKYIGKQWAWMEDVDHLGDAFDAEQIIEYIKRKHGDGRYRLEGREASRGAVLAWHPCVFIGDWKGAEDKALYGEMSATSMEPAPRKTKDIKDVLTDRVEIGTALMAEAKLNEEKTRADLAPMQMIVSMMTAMVTGMTSLMTAINQPKEDKTLPMLLTMQQQNTQFQLTMMEKMMSAQGNKGNIKELIEVVGLLRENFGDNPEPDTMSNIIKGIEVARPLLERTLDTMATRNSGGGPPPIALPAATEPAVPAEPDITDPTITEAQDMKAREEFRELIDAAVDLLKSRDYNSFQTILANLRNGAGEPLLVLNPDANPVVYIAIFGSVDARFKGLKDEIREWHAWFKQAMLDEEPDRDMERSHEEAGA